MEQCMPLIFLISQQEGFARTKLLHDTNLQIASSVHGLVLAFTVKAQQIPGLEECPTDDESPEDVFWSTLHREVVAVTDMGVTTRSLVAVGVANPSALFPSYFGLKSKSVHVPAPRAVLGAQNA